MPTQNQKIELIRKQLIKHLGELLGPYSEANVLTSFDVTFVCKDCGDPITTVTIEQHSIPHKPHLKVVK